MRTRRRLALLLGGTLIASLLSASAAVPASACAMETVTLRTFKIDVKPPKKPVPVGGKAVFEVHVVRPADEDPLALGVSTDGVPKEPAADVNVGVGLLVGDVFFPGFGQTDQNGDTKISVKIEKYAKAASVDAAFYAWKIVQDAPCLRVEENGFTAFEDLFEVRN